MHEATRHENVEAIVNAWAADKIARGEMIYDVQKWQKNARDRIQDNERVWPGYIEGTVRAMNDDDTDNPLRRVPAAEALRRLYEAKLGELTRYGVRDPDRTQIAVDYACGEVWRCNIEPMPTGGIVQLENELYRAIGFDRLTGARFAPAGERA